ncbi:MAG: tyrosine-type recombinase/integrase [Candidatus Thiodiazotropha taylori]|nr:tyrosine-type recombinase/integrase [Candidatus Thiodiazotropha taylori]MCW4285959.1 tyrosine-type recombinase/integrase [Candidatus Thiodiazotropha taylori]
MAFLVGLHKRGLKYSAFQTARAAINNFVQICGGTDFSSHYLIKRFMQGIHNIKPSLPRYDTIWDVQVVLSHMEKMKNLTLLELSSKLCMLFLLVTAQRCQTLHLIEMDDLHFRENSLEIKTNHVLKQTRPGYHLHDIVLDRYHNNNLCIIETLNEYLQRTQGLRTDKKLLVSTQKPHQGVSQATVSRWVKILMLKAGIKKQFGVHSTRAASTSAARAKGVPIASIIKTAGWSNARTFEKFYHRTLPKEDQPLSFQSAILSKDH